MRQKSEYAIYKGEEILVIGTAEECAEKLNISPKTVRHYTTPRHRRRVEKRKNPDDAMIAIKIELEPNDEGRGSND